MKSQVALPSTNNKGESDMSHFLPCLLFQALQSDRDPAKYIIKTLQFKITFERCDLLFDICKQDHILYF